MSASTLFSHRRSWSDYSEIICADPSRILLIPERSASDHLLQKLSDRRESLIYAKHSYHWPHPGVFRLQDYAQAILKEFERSRERFSASRLRLPSKIESLKRWLELSSKDSTVLDAFEELSSCQIFYALGLHLEEWKSVLSQYESSSELELKQLTQKILRFLQFEASFSHGDFITSNWRFLELATEALKNQALQNDFNKNFFLRLSSRPPQVFTLPHVLTLVSLHELYPVERRFLEALAGMASQQSFVFEFLGAENVEDFSQEKLKALESKLNSISNWIPGLHQPKINSSTFAIAGSELKHEISANEALALIPGKFLIDIPEPAAARGEPIFSSLRASLAYQSQNCSKDHHFLHKNNTHRENILKFSFHEQLIQLESFQPHEFWSTLLNDLEKTYPLRVDELEALRDQVDTFLKATHWLSILRDQGFFDFAHENAGEAPSPRIDSRGVFVGGVTEALLLGATEIAILGDSLAIVESLNPKNIQHERDYLISPQLDRCIEAQGKNLPKAEQEAKILRASLTEFPGTLFQLPSVSTEVFQDSPALGPDFFQTHFSSASQVKNLRLSASGISTYARCSLQYAIRNLWRFETSEEWDPQSVPKHIKGQWIHRVLETLYQLPDFPSPLLPWLSSELDRRLPEIFAAKVSKPYESLVAAQIPELSEQINLFISKYESSWKNSGQTRAKVLTELNFNTQAWGIQWVGTIDRIDVLPQGKLLLWDYKSGKVPKGDVEKQLAQGHLQWPLYTLLINQMPASEKIALGLSSEATVVGGGYLQSLEPESSSLFVDENQGPLLSFFEDLNSQFDCKTYPWVAPLHTDVFVKQIFTLKTAIQQEIFEARPLEESMCKFCEVASFCGRPFLKVENIDTSKGIESA
jgi:RecB family exonuclease